MAIFPPAMQNAFTVFGSLITCTSQAQLAESGRKRTACAIRRSVISRTFSARGVPVSICFFLSSWPIIWLYAAADCVTAILSETIMYWLRPVSGLVEQPAKTSRKIRAERRMGCDVPDWKRDFTASGRVRDVTGCFFAAPRDDSAARL